MDGRGTYGVAEFDSNKGDSQCFGADFDVDKILEGRGTYGVAEFDSICNDFSLEVRLCLLIMTSFFDLKPQLSIKTSVKKYNLNC